MVRDLERVQKSSKFPESAPAGEAVFYRTYSRRQSTGRESWQQVGDRILEGLVSLGKLTPSQAALTAKMQQQLKSLSSGRWLWVGGTQWLEKPENFSGAYNCTSTNVVDWRAFGLMMDLAMMGCGTGAVIEPKYINQLPAIRNRIIVELQGKIGTTPAAMRREQTEININNNIVTIYVGDSRAGWVKSYQTLLELSSDERFTSDVIVQVVLDDIRGEGERLQGFGGVANPVKLSTLYDRCASILNKALGRQLNSVECCLLIDEAAVVVVAGNVRRCLPGEALVHTESGLVPIQKIRIGDRVLTSKGFYPVTNFFDQGTQSLCRIKTQNGYFECTPDHKVAVLTDVYGNYQMVKAKNLTEGDRLIFVPQSIPGTATELPEFRSKSSQAKPITIPALTTDVAYFLGYLHGDGSVAADGSRVRFRIAEHQPEICDRLVSVAQSFGLDTYTLRTPEQCKAKAFELQLNSSNLNRYLAQFKKSFTSISIPDCILLGTLDIRKAYLAGLADADGCHSQGVLVASVHQDFLRQVQAVYASLGITTRQCSSVRKRNNKWEGELVTVGHDAYESTVTLLSKYSAYFSTTQRNKPGSFKEHGFPKLMARPLVSSYKYGWGNQQEQIIAPTLRKLLPNVTDLTPIKVKSVEMDVRTSHTYDIEVATIHEFVCEGILVSNSAGMRQGVSEDELFANAKGNLWHQDENGNWRIDPERDALRMANHTRVFHRKPSLDECINAVRQQYYSGEGAIQWAGEAIARANADIVNTLELKKDFLKTYTNSEAAAADWLLSHVPEMPAKEVEHRLSRYALNPCGEILGTNFHCVSGDTQLITRDSIHKIKDVVGEQIEIWNGKRWSKVVPFQTNTGQKLYRVRFADGSYLDATEYHRFFVKDRFGKEYKEVQTKDLLSYSKYSIHTEPFTIDYLDGVAVDSAYAYTLGVAVGDGTIDSNGKAKIRLYQKKMELLVAGKKSPERNYSYLPTFVDVTDLGFSGELLQRLKNDPDSLNAIASWHKKAILAFIAGLADTDGSNTDSNGIRIYVSDYQRANRLQLLLSKCAIRSSVNIMARQASTTNLGQTKDLYYLQITDCAEIPCQRLDTTKGHKPTTKGKWQSIQSVEELPGHHDTYCFNEPEFNKGVFGNTLTGNCNLAEIHLNQINPHNYQEQKDAFTAGALSVASLLNHQFIEERYQSSRELDPIVGVSFTGLFDFFVNAFGTDWLRWWEAGRPQTEAGLEFKQQEEAYLSRWKAIVNEGVWHYCDEHNLKRPNRCTTVQPSGTKSLLTGASPGWHPPKAQRFIRRITFRKNDPVALACIDYGYNIVPSQSDKDEKGNLLNNPFDDRCTEWLVEIPVAVPWADFPGADEIEISQFSAAAQMDFYMQVQKHYVAHNTSATIELREHEIESLGTRIYEAIRDDEGYISAALLARFDAHQTFPRLPFEPITKETYDQLMQEVKSRRQTDDFYAALSRYDSGEMTEAGPAGCDSDKCLFAAEESK